jgi:hypothetical protein
MIPQVTTVLQRFKTEWAAQLQPEAISAACEAVGHTMWRDRLLNPVITVQLFLLQILHGHTACRHLPHLAGFYFSASAYCQARAKLPVRVLEHLLERLGQSVQSTVSEEGRWHGHRTFFVDGSGCSMPDAQVLQEEFGQPSEQRPGCGFPVVRLLALFHAGTGLLTKLVSAPLLTHDLAQVQKVHPALDPEDVLVADRGLCSYAHIALLIQGGMHAVFQVSARQIVDFTPHRPFVMPATRRSAAIKGLPRSRGISAFSTDDQLVEWLEALPPSLVVRELQYDVTQRGFRSRQITVVTTLLDTERYPCADLAALYWQRWEAETHLAQLKTTMKMDVLHGQTVPGVHKELLVCAILYHLVRLVILQSAKQQEVGAWHGSAFWMRCDGSGPLTPVCRWRPYSSIPYGPIGSSPGSKSGGPKPSPS